MPAICQATCKRAVGDVVNLGWILRKRKDWRSGPSVLYLTGEVSAWYADTKVHGPNSAAMPPVGSRTEAICAPVRRSDLRRGPSKTGWRRRQAEGASRAKWAIANRYQSPFGLISSVSVESLLVSLPLLCAHTLSLLFPRSLQVHISPS